MEDYLGSQDSARCRLSAAQIEEVARIQRAVRERTAQFATDEQMVTLWKLCGVSGCVDQE
jgi:hypothetical protein